MSNRISKDFLIYDSIDYTNVRNEGSRTIKNESNIPVNDGRSTVEQNYINGLAAQQPFPNHVCIKFSAPPLKLKKNYKFSKKMLIILLSLIIILFFIEKYPIVDNLSFIDNGYNEYGDNEYGCHKPEIPWKGPKEFEIDPKEFENFEIIVSGQAAKGNLFITRSSGNASSIDVKTQILLSHESLQHKVEIIALHDLSNYVLQVKTPESCFLNYILVNINITFPKNLISYGKFSINVINLNIHNDDLKNITFNNIDWKSNPSISAKNLTSREIRIYSRGEITGNYYIDKSLLLQTSNAQINATTKSFSDSIPESIKLLTSNSAIQGSFPLAHLFEAGTSCGKIDLNITSTSQNKRPSAGKVTLHNTNGNIDGTYDFNSEWHASTSNGNINVKLNPVNLTELIRISGMTSNGKISTSISDSYNGRFRLQTSNGKIMIGRSNDDISYDTDIKSLKTGYKGEHNNNELSLFSSNGKIDLAFF